LITDNVMHYKYWTVVKIIIFLEAISSWCSVQILGFILESCRVA